MYSTEFPLARRGRPTLKDRAKLVLGALLFPAQTRRWKRYVQLHPVLLELAPALPKIIHKIYRPYLSNHLGCTGRVGILMDHYSLIGEAGLLPLIRHAATEPVRLAGFEGKSGVALALHLSAIRDAHREGELALHLSVEGRTIYTASFTLLMEAGEPRIALGSLQGVSAADGAALIKQCTRELHGWRPKSFMIAVLRQLGACLGCSTLVLVSNHNRIVVNWRRSERISADYDATWREMNAARRSDGNFELPCPAESLAIASAPSHKRSEMRKRAALLSSVDAQIATTLSLSRYATGRFHVAPPARQVPALDLAGLPQLALVERSHRRPGGIPEENIQAA